MGLVILFIIGVFTALLAKQKGRTAIGWFFIGFFFHILGLILVLVVSNVKEQREREEQLQIEHRRLQEQLRQERMKNEQFRKYTQGRLDTHDDALGLDTKHVIGQNEGMQNLLTAEQQQAEAGEPVSDTERKAVESKAYSSSDGEDTGWYYEANGAQVGPVTLGQLRQYFTDGLVGPSTYVWHRSLVDWIKADRVAQLNRGGNA